MKRLLLLFALLLVAGCAAPKQQPCPLLPWNVGGEVADIRHYPQDPMFYAKRLENWLAPSAAAMQEAVDTYRERFFSPWSQSKTGYSREQALWALRVYGAKQGYGENLRPRNAAWFQDLARRVDAPAFPSLALPAIAVRNTSLRSMPTQKPFFYDPHQAGEGFPFDYFQNSALWAGTPVFISHRSSDGGWLYAEAPFAAGWVPAQDLALVDDAFIQRCRQAPLSAILRDNTSLRDSSGDFVLETHIGALFPMQAENPAAVLAPVRNASGQALLLPASMPANAAAVFPLPLKPQRIALLAQKLMDTPYGWGGLFENRDCSAMTRDLLAPFGLWLPRNSKAQVNAGQSISLEGLSPEAKEQKLLKEGAPFRTLVGQPGHVMLYLGPYEGRAMLLHTIWGLRTKDDCGRDGRQIIGRTVITTLTAGSELEAVQRSGYSLQKRIHSLAILPDPQP